MWEVERALVLEVHGPHAHCQGPQEKDHDQRGQGPVKQCPGNHQKGREEHVVLLLHSQGPGVEEGFDVVDLEVVCCPPEVEVGGEQCCCAGAFGQAFEV